MKPLIMLNSVYSNIGLIIPCNSGVIYQMQACGNSCQYPSIEGIFIPLDPEDERYVNELIEYFSDGWTMIDEKSADFIDDFFSRCHTTKILTVDRERLYESMESWVYVNIENQPERYVYNYDFNTRIGTSDCKEWDHNKHPEIKRSPYDFYFFGFGECKGIFIWPNSD